MFDVTCPRCSAAIPAADVDLPTQSARCVACQAVFGFRPAPSGAAGLDRPTVAMPKGFTVDVEVGGVSRGSPAAVPVGTRFQATRTWRSAAAYFMAFFALCWDGFLLVWFAIALSQGAWVMAAFGLLHAAVGVGLTYSTLAMFVNRTTFTVGDGRLRVRHGPLPWWGGLEVPSAGIQQLFCVNVIRRTKNGQQETFEVRLRSTDGRELGVVNGLTERDQALWIEQQLERALRIRDEPVRGELER